jgi:hypothetical protein
MFDDYGDAFVHPSAEPQQEDDIVITDVCRSVKPQMTATFLIKQELIEDMEQDMEQSPTTTPSLVSVKRQLKDEIAANHETPSSSSTVPNRSDASTSAPPPTPNFVNSCVKTAANKVESFSRSHIH